MSNNAKRSRKPLRGKKETIRCERCSRSVTGEGFWSEAFEDNPLVSPAWVAAVQCAGCQWAVCGDCLEESWWIDAERPCERCGEPRVPWMTVIKQNALTADIVGYLNGATPHSEPRMMDRACGKASKSGYPWQRPRRGWRIFSRS